jgi:DNA-binding SARP family transcriptional activator/predicted ATPase
MERLCFKFLGGFEVHTAGKEITAFESDKARALLAYLAVESDHPQRRETLAGLFWPEKSESAARHSLSQALYSLHKTLQPNTPEQDEGLLITMPQMVQMRLGDHAWLDVRQFEAYLGDYHRHKHPPEYICTACQEALERAVKLYRGEFLAGISLAECDAFEDWLRLKREAFHEGASRALGALGAYYEAVQNLSAAAAIASQLVALDPYLEQAQRSLIRLYFRQGLRTEALAQYSACSKVLKDDLGIEPEQETQDLYRLILENHPSSVTLSRHNLPASLAPMVGRCQELDQLCTLLTSPDHRLVTILGPGGMGKTHLALEVGVKLSPVFKDGAYLVDLGETQTHPSLLAAIINALSPELGSYLDNPLLARHSGVKKRLAEFVGDKCLLLILDGFEAVVEDAPLVADLLHQAPGLKILAASRARLGLKSEQIFWLDGLSFPPNDGDSASVENYASIQLFLQAARRTLPGFAPSGQDLQSIVEITRLNQGMPLGILLAAAWIGVMPPGQILAEINRSLDFLASSYRDLPERQRSLRATFDYSWRFLGQNEQKNYTRLSILRSPFSTARASQVAGVSIHLLKLFLDQSLLLPAGMGRYRWHDLLRQFAQEKLSLWPDESLSVHEQHSQVFMAALAAWQPALRSQDQFAALKEMDLVLPDLRAAWDFAAAHGALAALENAAWTLQRYYFLHSQGETGAAMFESALRTISEYESEPDHWQVAARLEVELARLLLDLHQFTRAQEILQPVVQGFASQPSLSPELRCLQAEAILLLAQAKLALGADRREMLRLSEQGLALMRECGDAWQVSWALLKVIDAYGYLGDNHNISRLTKEALSIQQTVGDPELITALNIRRGYVLMFQGQHDQALECVRQQVAYYQVVNDLRSQALSKQDLGVAHFHAGRYSQALPLLTEAVALFERLQDPHGVSFPVYLLAATEFGLGHYQRARQIINEYGHSPQGYPPASWALVDGLLLLQEGQYDLAAQGFQQYLAYMRLNQRPVLTGIPLVYLGYIAYRQNDLPQAQAYLVAALETALDYGYFFPIVLSLMVIASILAEQEMLEQAVELYALALPNGCQEAVSNEDLFGKRITALAAALPAEMHLAAEKRGQAHDLWATGKEYLARLEKAPSLLAGLNLNLES